MNASFARPDSLSRPRWSFGKVFVVVAVVHFCLCVGVYCVSLKVFWSDGFNARLLSWPHTLHVIPAVCMCLDYILMPFLVVIPEQVGLYGMIAIGLLWSALMGWLIALCVYKPASRPWLLMLALAIAAAGFAMLMSIRW